jgi:hypothetical protein
MKLENQWQAIELEMKKAQTQETLKMVAAAAPQFVEQVRSSIAAMQELDANHTGMEESDAKMQALLDMQAELGNRKEEEVNAALAELDAQSDQEAKKEQKKLKQQIKKLNVQKQGAIKKKTIEQDALVENASSDQDRSGIVQQNRTELLEFMKLLDDEEARQIAKLEDKARQREEQRFQKRRAFEQQFSAQFTPHEDALKVQFQQAQHEQAANLEAQNKELSTIQVGYQSDQTTAAHDQLKSKLRNKMKQGFKKAAAAEAAAAESSQPAFFKQAPAGKPAAKSSSIMDGKVFSRMKTQMMDPLVSRIENIEQMLISKAQNHGSVNISTDDSYMDSKDTMWKQTRGTKIVIMSPEGLSAVQHASYQQASKAIRSLPQGMHRIASIIPSSELPATLSTSNAFSESYNFDPGTGKLHIRVERFDNLGELLTVLAHANAHIQCGSMESDQDPRFQAELYKGLMALMAPQAPSKLQYGDSADGGFTINSTVDNTAGILAEVQIAQAAMIDNQNQQKNQQKQQLERKMTERSAKRDAQVKSIMKSKLTGGSATLSKAQARAQKTHVKRLFDAIDVDHSGALDSDEVDGLLNLLGIQLARDDHDRLMEQFGQDRVPFDVFFQWYSN